MPTVLFDTNIFDKIAGDNGAPALLWKLSNEGLVRLIIPRTVRDELSTSPHQELLAALPIEVVGNATPVAGLMRADDFLGDADHYFNHKGKSSKESDALVAAAAEFHADWLVSEDHRLARRQQQLPQSAKTLTYAEFLAAANALR